MNDTRPTGQWRDASVLVTGGNGFLGSHLTRRLSREGARVHLIVRPASRMDRLSDVRPVPECTRLELHDSAALEDCIRRAGPQTVFHLAAATSSRGQAGRIRQTVALSDLDLFETNVLGTARLLHAIGREAASARVIRTGSLTEYGHGPVPFREEQREEPVSPYAASLVAATHVSQAVFRQTGLQVSTMRFALTYGPAQSVDFLVPALIRACLEERPFEMTAGTQTRDLLFVDDAVDALLAAAVSGWAGEIVNAGSGGEYRIADVAALIVRLTGSRAGLRIGALPIGRADLDRLVCDPGRARDWLGWTATTPLEEGLERTIAWHRANPAT